MAKQAKNTICLWYNGDAEDAARFYAETFPDSSVGAVHRAPGDFPSGKKGDVLTVEFTVMGVPCLGLNGGPRYATARLKSSQAVFSTDDDSPSPGGDANGLWNGPPETPATRCGMVFARNAPPKKYATG